MTKKQIPQIIKDLARKNGCNEITYVGRIDNADVWSFSQVDKDGITVPAGLPYFVKYHPNGKTEEVSGQEAFALIHALEA